MLRSVFLIVSFLLFFKTSGQTKEVIFDSKVQPNREYVTKTTSYGKMEIHFQGPEELFKAMKENGNKNPMIFESSNSIVETRRTFDLEADSTFQATILYGYVENVEIINGERNETESPFSKLYAEGFYNSENLLKIDSLVSNVSDVETRRVLIYSLENSEDGIKFPDYPLTIGDSFKSSFVNS